MSDKVCKKCGGTRFSKTGCYYCAKERGRIYRINKGKKPHKKKPLVFCVNCDKETERISNGKCKMCCDRYKLKYSGTAADAAEQLQCQQNNRAFMLWIKRTKK